MADAGASISELRNLTFALRVLSFMWASMVVAPKRHHFIPQMMLRHFADDDGQIWFWRRGFEKGDVRKTATKNVFVEKDLYTLLLPDGAKDVALEQIFARMEAHGAEFIAQIAETIRNGQRPKLDLGAWEFWDLFFYYHMKRAPRAIEGIAASKAFEDEVKAAADEIRAIRGERGDNRDEPGLEDWIAKNAKVIAQAAKPAADLQAQLKRMGLAIYRITDPNKSFVIGDLPGAMAKFRHGAAWSPPTLFFPLTSCIAVGLLADARKVDVVDVDRDQARRMNVATTALSATIAGRSKALVASLSADAPNARVCHLEAKPGGKS